MADAATYEAPQEPEAGPAFVKMWLDALNLAETEEKDWREEAEKTVEIYRGKDAGRKFNILHSNIETICPALYNSTPVPDVRRRFSDDDPIGKVVSDILERAISLSIDNYDFDDTIKLMIRDGELAGRGVPRVRYVPTFAPLTDPNGQPVLDDKGNPQQQVAYEAVNCEYVPWRYFRRGPGRSWQDVPWVAFGDFLDKEQVAAMASAEVAGKIPYDHTPGIDGKLRKAGTDEPSVFQRALVWQIWDKENRRVISISPGYSEAPVAIVPDPLGLTNFFPVPRPYQPIVTTDSLVPIVPYSTYRELDNELNEVTSRISRLVRQMRPRGAYVGNEGDLKIFAEAGDGDMVPITSQAMMNAVNSGKGLAELISWFPLEPTTRALAQLVNQRDQIKQTIYEATGISDILRGATNAAETATAQQIKSQWGSLRIQDRQQEIARIARDLFRMKAEIIATKFSWDTLTAMTGIKVPTEAEVQIAKQMVAQFTQETQQAQANGQPGPPMPENAEEIQEAAKGPTREQVEAVLRDDITRSYRIDVESDSTIRGDLTRNQQTMALFLQGTAQFAAAMGPLVQNDPAMLHPVMEVYASFARQFKLGKQAEDALDGVSDLARNGKGGAQKADPKADADKAQAEAKLKHIQLETERDNQKHANEMAKINRESQRDEQKFELEQKRFDLKEREHLLKLTAQPMQGPPPVPMAPPFADGLSSQFAPVIVP